MQNFNRQSPLDVPSSSETSKQSSHNITNSTSIVSNKNLHAPEVRQISQ